MNDAAIRPARSDDVPAILGLIRELADYERALDEVLATEEQITEALFGESPRVHAHVAEHEGAVAGFALWFLNFSTWQGRHGIYLEDLYVRPELRGQGYGKALLSTLAALCVERGYARLEWSCLDWNEPARGFYRSMGAEPMEEWTVHRLSGDALAAAGKA
ncbi:GNAT family N-acetyltransferase [Motilibacter aurantiacus]|uniref:GNAT family N-acetyltransferase n=1 Tax=Motilibacter aurantiacus TaxID=2714955 RepID=UPI00140B452A|nr:GNAT family N-acetyltransferase [Motilibacter aurantiacus]NHC43704.1 GNAT family N-acetyltransferase [Motilibacter aurantiacus]